MSESRHNPDQLLKEIQADEENRNKGHLKIFFGYAAGVGKTYAMLEAAHMEKQQGIDVVAGYVETHARPKTAALLNGLEVLPTREVFYNGMILDEFDIQTDTGKTDSRKFFYNRKFDSSPGDFTAAMCGPGEYPHRKYPHKKSWRLSHRRTYSCMSIFFSIQCENYPYRRKNGFCF